MDTKKETQKNEGIRAPQKDVSTNPELGIKRIRTFADDLKEAEAKSKGGEQVTKKQAVPPVPKKVVVEEKKEPNKDFIEKELERSGIVTNNRTEEKEKEEKEKKKTSIPNIRTYKNDTAESIKEGGVSKIEMLAAEQKRRVANNDFSQTRPDERESSIGKNIGIVVLSIFLITSSAWAAYYFYNKSRIVTEQSVEENNSGVLLFTDTTQDIDVGDLVGKEMLSLITAQMKNLNTAEGDIVEINILQDGIFGKKKPNTAEFLNALEGFVPKRITRTLGDTFVLGGSVKNSVVTPFLLLKTSDFDVTFAGMLEWENTLLEDLSPLFGTLESNNFFTDVIVKNKDTRLLKGSRGNTLLLYSFPNTDTILITPNEETFIAVFERLTVSNASRN